jgi:hypothetical protein
MTRTQLLAIVMWSMLGAAGVAHAQSISLPLTGTCVGANGVSFAALVGLAVPDGQGNLASIQTASVSTVFGAAECQCGTKDVNLEIKLTTPLPAGFTGNVQVYVGNGCENPALRNSGTPAPCELLTEDVPPASVFIQGQGIDLVHIPLPSQALFSPNAHTCTPETHFNNVYLFIGADPNAPTAVCFLSLTEQNNPPDAPAGVQATRDADGTVELGWTLPPTSTNNPQGYQVLCSDDDGKPASGLAPDVPLFSECDAGVMHRRALNTAASFDQPPPPPGFVCSPLLSPVSSHTRVSGLDRTKSYHVTLVGVDGWGNAARTAAVTVGPAPALPPAMPVPVHGCSVGAGAARTSPLALALLAGALATLAWRRRRARA